MKRWMMMVCCVGVLLVGCGGKEAAPQAMPTQTRVACVGDSITQGFGGHGYVDLLAAQLDVVCGNFGVCGTTALGSGAPSYRDTGAYAESLAWQADVVVLMLGTNDTAYWRGRDAFAVDYEALVASYLETGAKVVLCTPLAPAADAWDNGYGICPGYFAEVCGVIREVAASHGLSVVDVYSLSEGADMTLEDGIHPNACGARCISEAVAQVLTAEALI